MKKNDIIGIFRYAKVIDQGPSQLLVEDVFSGARFKIVGEDMIKKVMNATSFTETKKVTRTELENILLNVGNKPVTVSFVKSDGKNRTMAGTREGDGKFGRSLFREFGKDGGLKQVDHRTLNRIVLDGVEYLVK